MKIYTKTGDQGETGLFGGPRVRKDHARIEAYGAVDELNACLGLVRTEALGPELDALLARMQHRLFDLGAELATPDAAARGQQRIAPRHAQELEQAIDRYESSLTPLKQFILPGGTRGAALLHVARTICRRAERRCVTLAEQESVGGDALIYLNRLGDLLFVLARAANAAQSCTDVPWQPDAPAGG